VKFLADESVDFPIVKSLRKFGFDVSYIAEICPGVTDVEVIEIAGKQSRILITADKDFGTLTFRNKLISEGVVLCRLSGLSNAEKAQHVSEIISEHMASLTGSFTVIGRELTRIRKLPE
jgi:predicted nuclease of predicted toxin-antitoxin system